MADDDAASREGRNRRTDGVVGTDGVPGGRRAVEVDVAVVEVVVKGTSVVSPASTFSTGADGSGITPSSPSNSFLNSIEKSPPLDDGDDDDDAPGWNAASKLVDDRAGMNRSENGADFLDVEDDLALLMAGRPGDSTSKSITGCGRERARGEK